MLIIVERSLRNSPLPRRNHRNEAAQATPTPVQTKQFPETPIKHEAPFALSTKRVVLPSQPWPPLPRSSPRYKQQGSSNHLESQRACTFRSLASRVPTLPRPRSQFTSHKPQSSVDGGRPEASWDRREHARRAIGARTDCRYVDGKRAWSGTWRTRYQASPSR